MILTVPAKEKKVLITFRVDLKNLKRIREKAEKHTGGNITAWLTYAGTMLEPKRENLFEEY